MKTAILTAAALFSLALAAPESLAGDFTQWLQEKAESAPEQARRLALGAEGEQAMDDYAAENQLQTEGAAFSEMRPPTEARASWKHGSVELSGEESAAVVNRWKDPGFQQAVSVGLWIKPDFSMFEKSKEGRFIVSKSASVESGFFLTVGPDRSVTAALVTTNGFVSARALNALENYRWSHIGFSWDGETLQLYIDGEKRGEPVNAPGDYKDYAAGCLTFGRPASLPVRFYKGLIADFILWPEAYPN